MWVFAWMICTVITKAIIMPPIQAAHDHKLPLLSLNLLSLVLNSGHFACSLHWLIFSIFLIFLPMLCLFCLFTIFSVLFLLLSLSPRLFQWWHAEQSCYRLNTKALIHISGVQHLEDFSQKRERESNTAQWHLHTRTLSITSTHIAGICSYMRFTLKTAQRSDLRKQVSCLQWHTPFIANFTFECSLVKPNRTECVWIFSVSPCWKTFL